MSFPDLVPWEDLVDDGDDPSLSFDTGTDDDDSDELSLTSHSGNRANESQQEDEMWFVRVENKTITISRMVNTKRVADDKEEDQPSFASASDDSLSCASVSSSSGSSGSESSTSSTGSSSVDSSSSAAMSDDEASTDLPSVVSTSTNGSAAVGHPTARAAYKSENEEEASQDDDDESYASSSSSSSESNSAVESDSSAEYESSTTSSSDEEEDDSVAEEEKALVTMQALLNQRDKPSTPLASTKRQVTMDMFHSQGDSKDMVLLVVCSVQDIDSETALRQQQTLEALRSNDIPHQIMDADDPENRTLRDSLFALSDLSHYPQMFVHQNGETSYWGDWEDLMEESRETAEEEDQLGLDDSTDEEKAVEKPEVVFEFDMDKAEPLEEASVESGQNAEDEASTVSSDAEESEDESLTVYEDVGSASVNDDAEFVSLDDNDESVSSDKAAAAAAAFVESPSTVSSVETEQSVPSVETGPTPASFSVSVKSRVQFFSRPGGVSSNVPSNTSPNTSPVAAQRLQASGNTIPSPHSMINPASVCANTSPFSSNTSPTERIGGGDDNDRVDSSSSPRLTTSVKLATKDAMIAQPTVTLSKHETETKTGTPASPKVKTATKTLPSYHRKVVPPPVEKVQVADPAMNAYEWYTRLGYGSRSVFEKRIQTLPASCGVYPEHVDLLPWNSSQTGVDFRKIRQLILQKPGQ